MKFFSHGDRRSQASTIGFVLVFALMIAGALVVVAIGSNAVVETEKELTDERAEMSLTQFGSQAALVALEESDSQRFSFARDGQFRVDPEAGGMIVRIENRTDGTTQDIMNITLGALVYDTPDTTIAYQGGGVWRPHTEGEPMITPPEFHYRNGTLTLPAISIDGDRSISHGASIRQAGETKIFPNDALNLTNPLETHEVTVTVESDYYRGWGQYFGDRTDGDVDYDEDANAVTATLVSPVNVDEVTAASASLSAGGEFNVSGSSQSDCGDAGDVYTDSYHSENGTYCSQWGSGPPGTNGDVVYGKDIDISDGTGGSNFYGDIESGQTVTVDDSSGAGQPTVYGNISYVEKCISDKDNDTENCEERIADSSGGEVRAIDGITLTNSVDWFIETTAEDIESDAGATNPAIEGQTLDAGEYYFDSFDLSTNLTLDTTDGNVVIAVNESVTLEDDASIEVIGDHHAQLFIEGNGPGEDLTMANDAWIYNTNDNATKFRLYGKSDFQAILGEGGSGNLARFVGVIYAPPGTSGTGHITLDGGEVFGGILTGTTAIKGGSIHYDEALEGKNIVPEDARIIKVTYLHVSEHHIRIENE
jgi:hypothetical protein